MESLKDKIQSKLLPYVRGPGQYIGGEVNQIRKPWHSGDVTVALAFPDTYALGMSHLGLAILYQALNRREGIVAERVYCPWLDAVAAMRREGIPLFSWESRRPMRDFDMVGITLQHELSYSNILFMLDLAGITFRAEERHEDEPLVVGGGPLADSCEPVADFFDLVILGDGEEAFPAVIEAYRRLKSRRCSRRDLLIELAREFPFVYVPQLYHCDYHPDGTLRACEPVVEGVPRVVQRAMVTDLDSADFPTAPLVSFVETIHDRIAIEVMRGCPQRCAFCHAAHVRGPLRWRSVETILKIAEASYLATGHDTISLLSLSTSDHPQLSELVTRLYQQFADKRVGISLPSLRVDRQLRDVPTQVANVRREGLTVAVEAARDTLRKAMGKRVTDSDLLATMRNAYQAGWQKVKLYFMVGFPGETDDDIDGIVDLAMDISRTRQEVAGRPATVNAAVSWLVPKPHTPLAWAAQQKRDYFLAARERLFQANRYTRLPIKLKFHDLRRSILEGVFARGDRRLSRVLEEAYRQGAFFDSWDECFDENRYLLAMKQQGLDPDFYAHRQRPAGEVLPWAHLGGDNQSQLYTRWERIKTALGVT